MLRRAAGGVLFAGAMFLTACGESGNGGGEAVGASYTVMGRVTAPPRSETVEIRHSVIEGFVRADGRKTTLPPGVAPFRIGEGVSMAGIAEGDPVEVTFEIGYEAGLIGTITLIREVAESDLPAGFEVAEEALDSTGVVGLEEAGGGD